MIRWKKALTSVVHGAEEAWDSLKRKVGQHIGDKELVIVPYRGYGTGQKLYLRGRVLEDQGILPAEADDSTWRNLVNTYLRFESDEVPYARVKISFREVTQEAVADEEGYFEAWLEPDEPLPTGQLWHEVDLALLAPLFEGRHDVKATASLLVPPPQAQFGIISDMDDTVIHSNATNLWEAGKLVLMGNAHTRVPFAGVAAFYQALQHGAGATAGADNEEAFNPLFYVSSSPWNLYDLLVDFLELQNIPIGPLMLRDWGISQEELLPTKHGSHKTKSIRRILDFYPELPFILIGDSGQEDPEIYRDIVAQYPNRILAIYIRNVTSDVARQEAIRTLAEETARTGTTFLLVNDTYEAGVHAASQGWIGSDRLARIRDEVSGLVG